MKHLSTCIFLLTIGTANAGKIRYLDSRNSDSPCCHPATVALVFGPVAEIENSKDPYRLAWYYRVGVVVSEIYLAIQIEEIAIGEENTRTLISSRVVELGNVSVEDITWVSPSSLRFKMGNTFYQLTELDKPKVRRIEVKGR